MNLIENLSSNKAFIVIMGLVTIIQILILYFGGPVFRTIKLDINDLIIIIILAFTVIPTDMIRKFILSRTIGTRGT